VRTIRARRVAALGAAVLATAVLAACGGGDSSGGSGSDGDTIKIAMTGPLTGDSGQWGKDQIDGMQLAVDQINDAGGITEGPNKGKKLSLDSFDDAGDPNQGASVAQQLCDDTGVMAVLGPVNSSVALAVGPVYNRCGLTEVTSYASNPDITLKGYTNVFRSIPNDDQLSAADVAAAVQIAGAKTIAVVWSNDAYGQGLWEGVQAAAPDLGATIVGDASFTKGSTKDFSSILTNLQGKNPDALLLMADYSDVGLMTQQARQVGLDAPIVAPTGTSTPEFLDLAGQAAEGMLTPVLFDPSSQDPEVAQFVKDFQAKFNRDPGESSATGYGSVQLIEYALSQGATTREDVAKELSAAKQMPTLLGDITFDEHGDPTSLTSLVVLTVKDGKFVANDKQLQS
jgi:branched-chain amino acid transport system substrate-binding protein